MTRLPSTIKMISEDVIVKLSVRVIIRLHYIWFATVDCSLFFIFYFYYCCFLDQKPNRSFPLIKKIKKNKTSFHNVQL